MCLEVCQLLPFIFKLASQSFSHLLNNRNRFDGRQQLLKGVAFTRERLSGGGSTPEAMPSYLRKLVSVGLDSRQDLSNGAFHQDVADLPEAFAPRIQRLQSFDNNLVLLLVNDKRCLQGACNASLCLP